MQNHPLWPKAPADETQHLASSLPSPPERGEGALSADPEQAASEPLSFDGGLEPDAPDLSLTDPAMAMQLLRQHKPEVMRIRGSQGASASGVRPASDAEVRRALVRSLKAFGVRLTKEDLAGDDE